MIKDKTHDFSIPFIGMYINNEIIYDSDMLSLVGKVLNGFISYNRDNYIDYRDVLDCIGIKNNECILKGMPVIYKKRKDILPEDIDFACTFKNGSNKNLIVNSFCDECYVFDNADNFNNKFEDFILEINFFVSNYSSVIFKLLIDIYSGYIILCGDSFAHIYLINKEKVSGDKVAIKRSSYGEVSICPNKECMEWIDYNLDNPNNKLSYDEYYDKFIKKTNPILKLFLGK